MMLTERRLVALCTSVQLRSWIEAEIGDLVSRRHYARDVSGVIELLARGGASSSELLVLDLDLLSAAHTVGLKLGIDDHWWNGTIVAIGSQRSMHRRYLPIDHTISRPLGSEALRAVIERSDGEDTHPIFDWRKERPNKRNGAGR